MADPLDWLQQMLGNAPPGQQPVAAGGQQAPDLSPEAMQQAIRWLMSQETGLSMRPPLAGNVAPPTNTSGFAPLIDLQGGYSRGLGRAGVNEPLNYRATYRHTIPF